MADLTTKARHKLEKEAPSKFGLPAKKGEPAKYPMPDAAHAGNAKARAAQQVGKSITPAEKMAIDRKANAVIKKSGGNPSPPSGKKAS